MKIPYIKAIAAILIGTGLTGCGDKFLETELPNGVETEVALSSVKNIGYALNGTYYNLFYYNFAGNDAIVFGDLAGDVAYWNAKSQHFNQLYQFAVNADFTMLSEIWTYGYKVADNAARIIKAADELRPSLVDEDEIAELDRLEAEAYALRGYAQLMLTNIFAHQIKVDGTDFSSMPGIVIIDEPKQPYEQVSRSTVGESYAAIVSDFKASLSYFDNAGYDAGSLFYMNPAAVNGLLARTYLYMENYSEASQAAQQALDIAGISSLVVTPEAYRALYAGDDSNIESFFALAITPSQNWSAYSLGTMWSTYGYSPSPWLQSVMASDDCRRAVWGWSGDSTPETPIFNSGKFIAYGLGGNPANATNYIVNAPEMFLIKAEAALKGNHDVAAAAGELLPVAMRNPAIADVADLPAGEDDLMAFIKDERARELFQEGLRLYDLRRWGAPVNAYATGAPAIDWMVRNYNISDLVMPIPNSEINAGYGVSQNEGWSATLPK